MAARKRGIESSWLLPLVILTLGAGALFITGHLVDLYYNYGAEGRGFLDLLVHPNHNAAANAIGNLAEVLSAVLGIAITVVSIIVQLSATRYTPRITELFFKDRTNFFVIGFFVVAAIQCQWVSLSFGTTYIPRVGVAIGMFSMALSLILVVPYFTYVFYFLDPKNVITRIREQATKRLHDFVADGGNPESIQKDIVDNLEQLADVALNSVENKDKIIAMAAVDAIREFGEDYERIKSKLFAGMFSMPDWLRENPDFVSLHPDSVQQFESRKTWPEMKLLRQYQMIYNETLNRMRDLCYLVAINTRTVAKVAVEHGHDEAVELVVRYFNTYMRSTINARDVRTAYNVLNQYRLLAENLLDAGRESQVIAVCDYIKYYGQLAFQTGQPFITVTAAYDICMLNEIAFARGAGCADRLLEIFLLLDKESETEVQEQSLRGIRKAQIKLATYLLARGKNEEARKIFNDMRHEPVDRMKSIEQEMARVESEEFWEIIDRGYNFDYLPPEQRQQLSLFFSWFGLAAEGTPSDPEAKA